MTSLIKETYSQWGIKITTEPDDNIYCANKYCFDFRTSYDWLCCHCRNLFNLINNISKQTQHLIYKFAIDPSSNETFFCPATQTFFQKNKTVFEILNNNAWTVLPPTLTNIARCAEVCANENYVVLTGLEVQIYDKQQQKWHLSPRLNYPRNLHHSFFIKNDLFVVGGVDEFFNQTLNSVEKCNMLEKSKSWVLQTPMQYPRVLFQSCLFGLKFYVFGGHQRYFDGYDDHKDDDCMTDVEAYDTLTNVWTKCASMPYKHCDTPFIANQLIVLSYGHLQEQTYDTSLNVWTRRETPIVWNF